MVVDALGLTLQKDLRRNLEDHSQPPYPVNSWPSFDTLVTSPKGNLRILAAVMSRSVV